MTERAAISAETDEGEGRARIRLPGFVSDADTGLGDAVARIASYLGAQPCGGCDARRHALNRWVGFAGRRRV